MATLGGGEGGEKLKCDSDFLRGSTKKPKEEEERERTKKKGNK